MCVGVGCVCVARRNCTGLTGSNLCIYTHIQNKNYSPHQGFILRARPLEYLNIDELPSIQAQAQAQADPQQPSQTTPHWLALDEVWDPQNLGALLRSAYFLGMQASVSVVVRVECDGPTNRSTNLHQPQPQNNPKQNRASSSAPRTRRRSRPPSQRPAPARWSSYPSIPPGTWSASWSGARSRGTGCVGRWIVRCDGCMCR